MLRVSVSILEKFRRWIWCDDPESQYDNEEKFLESLQGIFKGTPKTAFGGAFHQIIEGEYTIDRKLNIYQAGGFYFTHEQAKPALDYRNEHTAMVYEMNTREAFETKYGPIQVSGRTDGIEGLAIRDSKTKFRNPDYQEYVASCQWKLYLEMMEADLFYYDVFEVKHFKEDAYHSQKLFPDVVIEPAVPLLCTRYPGMRSDIDEILNLFMEYMTEKKLFHFLKPAWPNEQHPG